MKRIAALGLVALLAGGCGPARGSGDDDDDNGLVGNGGSLENPEYWLPGTINRSFKLRGQNNPVGFSSNQSENPTFNIEYKDIGTYNGSTIEIPTDPDIGDNYDEGIGLYIIIENGRLDPDQDPFYFGEGYWEDCPDESPTCIPVCENGQVWGDHLNEKLDSLGGFLLDYEGVGSPIGSRRIPTFIINGPWEGGSFYGDSEYYNWSEPCNFY